MIKHGHRRLRDLYPDYVENHSVYEFLAKAYLAKGDKADAIDELERYVHIGGRNPDTIMLLAKQLDRRRQQEGSRRRSGPAELHLSDGRTSSIRSWASSGSIRATPPAPSASSRRCWWRISPSIPAQAHYDLARAFNLNHQPDQAEDEVVWRRWRSRPDSGRRRSCCWS